jgi:hypothetical protein
MRGHAETALSVLLMLLISIALISPIFQHFQRFFITATDAHSSDLAVIRKSHNSITAPTLKLASSSTNYVLQPDQTSIVAIPPNVISRTPIYHPPSFSIASNPSSLEISQGFSGMSTITLTQLSQNPVHLTISAFWNSSSVMPRTSPAIDSSDISMNSQNPHIDFHVSLSEIPTTDPIGKFDLVVKASLPIPQTPTRLINQTLQYNGPLSNTYTGVLSWTSSPGAPAYNIYRSTPDNTHFTRIASVSQPSFNDANLGVSNIYYYYVTAVNGNEESSPSNSVSFQTGCGLCLRFILPYVFGQNAFAYSLAPGEPSPQNLLTPMQSSSGSGSGTNVVSDQIDIPVFINPAPDYILLSDSSLRIPAGSTVNSTLTINAAKQNPYPLDLNLNYRWSTEPLANSSATIDPAVISLAPGQSSTARLSVSSLSLFGPTGGFTICLDSAMQRIDPPTGLNVSQPSFGGEGNVYVSYSVNWNLVSGAQSYNIYRSTNSAGPFVEVGSVSGGISTFVDSAPASKAYYYYVTAVNGNGESKPSKGITASDPNRSPFVAPQTNIDPIANRMHELCIQGQIVPRTQGTQVLDFTLSSNPSAIQLVSGTSAAQSTIVIAAQQNNSGSLNIELSGTWTGPIIPDGVTATIVTNGISTVIGQQQSASPVAVKSGATAEAQLIVNAPEGIKSGEFLLTITAVGTSQDGAAVTHQINIPITIKGNDQSFDFNLAAEKSVIDLSPNSRLTEQISVSLVSGSPEPVSLQVISFNPDLTLSLDTLQGTPSPSFISTLKVGMTSNQLLSKSIVIQAIGGNKVHTLEIMLQASANPYKQGIVHIDSDPRLNSVISIDGSSVAAQYLATPYPWKIGERHTLQAQPVVYAGKDIRYVFDSWSDGSKQSNRTLLVAEYDSTIVGHYRPQYFLNVTSPFGQTSGSGWYEANTTVTFSVFPVLITDSSGINHQFNEWSGSSAQLMGVSCNRSTLASSPESSNPQNTTTSNTGIICMNNPQELVARWRVLENPNPSPYIIGGALGVAGIVAALHFVVAKPIPKANIPTSGSHNIRIDVNVGLEK